MCPAGGAGQAERELEQRGESALVAAVGARVRRVAAPEPQDAAPLRQEQRHRAAGRWRLSNVIVQPVGGA